MVQKTLNNVVNLFDIETEDNTSYDFLTKKSNSNDGLYKPDFKEAKDQTKGYVATIRFLPNITDEGTKGQMAMRKYLHYIQLQHDQHLNGYYDSPANFGQKCPLTDLFFKLRKSENAAEQQRASLVSRTEKFFSYVLIVEDEQHPELVGKIMVFSYGAKIMKKIIAQKDNEKCDVTDFANGKDFLLIIKKVFGFNNYDDSYFKSPSPIKIWDAKKDKLVVVPVVFKEERQKFMITDVKVQTAILNFLKTRTHTVEEWSPKPLTEQQLNNISEIVKLLSGGSSKPISTPPTKIVEKQSDDQSVDDFFDNIPDEDE